MTLFPFRLSSYETEAGKLKTLFPSLLRTWDGSCQSKCIHIRLTHKSITWGEKQEQKADTLLTWIIVGVVWFWLHELWSQLPADEASRSPQWMQLLWKCSPLV